MMTTQETFTAVTERDSFGSNHPPVVMPMCGRIPLGNHEPESNLDIDLYESAKRLWKTARVPRRRARLDPWHVSKAGHRLQLGQEIQYSCLTGGGIRGNFALSGDLDMAADLAALDGNWDGTLAAGALKLRLTFQIETTAGTMGGTMKNIDQGGAVVPLSEVSRDGARITIRLVEPGAAFLGTLGADSQSIAGNWMQSGIGFPLTLKRRAAGAAEPLLNRPQEPHPPYPYGSEELVFDGVGGNKIGGTLTLPEGRGPFAAAILIAGSGPHNRDEAIFGHKPFLVLADYLTRHGIAVLRCDKRGIGQSTGDYKDATSENFADDVEAAIAYLKTLPGIDGGKIGLIGHSEGGLIAPMVAVRDRSVAFVVLMAGPGLKGYEILMAQRHLIAKAMGEPADKLARDDAVQQKLLDAVVSATSADDAQAKAHAIMAAAKPELSSAAIEVRVAPLTSPWFRFLLTYDPTLMLRQVRCPVLAVNGEKDLQVPPKENLEAIGKALAGNTDGETIELRDLNHLLQTARTGAPSEYGDIEEALAALALETITTWIVKRTATRSEPSTGAEIFSTTAKR